MTETLHALQPLLDFATDAPILSLYLDVDPARKENQGSPRAYLIWLQNEVRHVRADIPAPEHSAFDQIAARVQRTLETEYIGAKGVAIFAGDDVWHMAPLDVAPENLITWGRPHLNPLAENLLHQQPYGVILVDKRRVRYFAVTPTTTQEVMDFVLPLDTSDWRRKEVAPPTSPERAAGTGVSGSNLDAYQARIDAQIRRFLTMAAAWAVNLRETHNVDCVVLGGPEETVVEFQSLLPGALHVDLITTAPIPVDAADSLIRTATEALVATGRCQRDGATVHELLETANARGRAVVGLDPVLHALEAGQAHAVFVDPTYAQTVKRCAECGHVSSSTAAVVCARCSGASQAVPLLPVLLELATATGSTVTLIDTDAAALLEPHDRIGAWLRYVPS